MRVRGWERVKPPGNSSRTIFGKRENGAAALHESRALYIGWSDRAIFVFFLNLETLDLYFYEFNSKKSANLAARALGKVLFSKITGTLKINIFLFANTFFLPKRTISKKKCELRKIC